METDFRVHGNETKCFHCYNKIEAEMIYLFMALS